MTDGTPFLSEAEALAAVGRLDRARLSRLIRAEIIRPASDGGRPVYRRVDIARMKLLSELCEDFELDDNALGIVMDLVDQLHGTRADLLNLIQAIAEEEQEVRLRVTLRVKNLTAG